MEFFGVTDNCLYLDRNRICNTALKGQRHVIFKFKTLAQIGE